MSVTIQKSTLQFLKDIKENNHRDWFTANKDRYQTALENVKAFQADLLDKMSEFDEIEAHKLFRIYRDVRFSKDKTPYKSSFSGSFTRATKFRRGGCFFNIEPGNSLVAGGFWKPNSADLKRIRTEIANNPEEFRAIIESSDFVKTWKKLEGDQVKTAPKGFSKEHSAIDLLRYKQYLVIHHFDDKEVTKADFAEKMSNYFKAMHPLFDYMTAILTTDENGVPIED